MSLNIIPTDRQIDLNRPLPFYFITTTNPDDLSFDAALKELTNVKEQGFGGIVLFNKPPHGFDGEKYLSKAWFSMVKNFATACQKLGLRMWINDGFDYPPGDAGGRINKKDYPNLSAKRLVLRDSKVVSEEVEWGFPAFEEPESAELFHKFVYERYLAEVGEFFGDTIIGFFSDADNRRVNYKVFWENSPQKDYYPWSSNFAETFSKHYGYDITPYLEGILKGEKGENTKDYWEHAGRLYQSWFKSNYKWLREHGLSYTFHTSDTSPFTWEEASRSSLYTEGRALDMESNCDYSGTDQELLEINGGKHMRAEEYWMPRSTWGGDNALVRNPDYRNVYGDLRAKQAGSAAFLHNKKGVMCEMFAASNWGVSPTELREIAAWQIMQGVTFVVPHAYHHRFLGETKYFAPPIFFSESILKESAKEINDTIAKYCYFASLGELKAPVALLDVTDDIWAGKCDGSRYMAASLELNRLPYGYVLADADSIVRNKEKFSVIVNAGAALTGDRKEKLEALGLPIIDADDLSQLADLVECKVSYKGEGTPHFMTRKLQDGEELVIIANIENGPDAISGTLNIDGSSFVVTIQSGELQFFTKDGQIDEKEQPVLSSVKTELPDTLEVSFGGKNLLPIERWSDADGNAVCKHFGAGEMYFDYSVKEEVTGLCLKISKASMDKIDAIFIDGNRLTDYKEIKVFADDYVSFDFAAGSTVGSHILTIKTNGELPTFDRIFIDGEFGVDIEIDEPYFLYDSYQYSLDKFIPKTAKVVIGKRTDTLRTDESWCEQGNIFYSGSATYKLSLSLGDEYKNAALVLNEVNDVCEVYVDGKFKDKLMFAPYIAKLGDMSGEHTVEIKVYNSMANAFEMYKEPSGITKGGYIGVVKG